MAGSEAIAGVFLFGIIFGIAWAIVVVAAVIVWLRVGLRWLQLNPAPLLPAVFPPPARPNFGTPTPDMPSPEYPEDDVAALRMWLGFNEPATALRERLDVGWDVASGLILDARSLVAGRATPAQLDELTPWIPRILNR